MAEEKRKNIRRIIEFKKGICDCRIYNYLKEKGFQLEHYEDFPEAEDCAKIRIGNVDYKAKLITDEKLCVEVSPIWGREISEKDIQELEILASEIREHFL